MELKKIRSPNQIMSRPLLNVAHKADVVRLQVLKQTGGIYLDLDTVCVKPLREFFSHSFVIGQEAKPVYTPRNWRQKIKHGIRKKFQRAETQKVNGLCNAVLLAEPDNSFVNLWLDSYSTFRSTGRDKYWNEHSVFTAMKLASMYPDKVTQVGPYAFHYPLYTDKGLQSMFETVSHFPEAYVHHLWETFSWNRYLNGLTERDIFEKVTTYNCIARQFL